MKVLFIGCGSIGKRHIVNIRQLFKSDVEILAYRTFAKSRHLHEDFFDEYSIQQYDSLNKALSQRPEVTFITNPTSLHIPAAIKAAYSGSHLFIEKPLSNDLKGIAKLEQLVKKKKLTTFVAFNFRFLPILVTINRVIATKEIGDILSIRAEVGQYLPEWHPHEDYSKNYSAIKSLGGGVILDLIHEIDYTRWLLGGDEIQEVFCYSSKFSKLNIETEDIAEILMRTKKAVVSIHLDYLQHPSTRICQIIGTKGKALIDIQSNTGKVFDHYGGITEFHPNSYFEMNFTYQDELKYFFDCVKKRKRTIIDITEGKKVLELALAVKKSARLSKPIKINNNLLTLDIE